MYTGSLYIAMHVLIRNATINIDYCVDWWDRCPYMHGHAQVRTYGDVAFLALGHWGKVSSKCKRTFENLHAYACTSTAACAAHGRHISRPYSTGLLCGVLHLHWGQSGLHHEAVWQRYRAQPARMDGCRFPNHGRVSAGQGKLVDDRRRRTLHAIFGLQSSCVASHARSICPRSPPSSCCPLSCSSSRMSSCWSKRFECVHIRATCGGAVVWWCGGAVVRRCGGAVVTLSLRAVPVHVCVAARAVFAAATSVD